MSDQLERKFPTGRKPAKHEPSLFVHQFALGVTGPVEGIGDVTGGNKNWPMLGNGPDPTCTVPGFSSGGVGDCFDVALELSRVLQAITGPGPSFEPTFRPAHANFTVGSVYFPYGRWAKEPGQYPDEGTNMAEGLQYLLLKKQIKRYGEVDLSQPNALQVINALMEAGYGVLLGLVLPTQYMQQWNAKQPWSTGPGNPLDPEAGHCVLQVKYNQGIGQRTAISWQQEQLIDDEYLANGGLEECWIVETNESQVNPKFDNATWDNAIANMPNYHGPVDNAGAPVAESNLETTWKELEHVFEEALTKASTAEVERWLLRLLRLVKL